MSVHQITHPVPLQPRQGRQKTGAFVPPPLPGRIVLMVSLCSRGLTLCVAPGYLPLSLRDMSHRGGAQGIT